MTAQKDDCPGGAGQIEKKQISDAMILPPTHQTGKLLAQLSGAA
jgi:hypothetical protein